MLGRYNGLAETEGEAIHYEIRSKFHESEKEKLHSCRPIV